MLERRHGDNLIARGQDGFTVRHNTFSIPDDERNNAIARNILIFDRLARHRRTFRHLGFDKRSAGFAQRQQMYE